MKLGEFLRSERLRQGIDIETAAEETNVKPVYLRALEDENYDLIPGEIYQRHYFKTYLEYLGHEELYYKLTRERPHPAQPSESMVRKPSENIWDTSRYVRVCLRFGLLIVALAIIISLASIAVARVFGDGEKTISPSEHQVDELVIDLPLPRDTVDAAIDAALGPSHNLGNIGAQINSATDTHTVRIETTAECYVIISGPSGKIFERTMWEGDENTFGPDKFFTITLGRPKAALVYLNNLHIYGGDMGQPPGMTFSLPADISLNLSNLNNPLDKVSGSN